MFVKPQQLEQQIKQKQFQINTKKISILIEWTSHLFTSYHRCLLCIVAEKSFAEMPLPIGEVEKFKNGANLLKDLMDGLLVSLVHKEKKVLELKINQEFFMLLPILIEKTKSKLRLQLNSKISQGSEQFVICKDCTTIRSQTEIQFIGETCKCEIPSFVPFERDQEKLKKLAMIGAMIDRVLAEYQGIKKIEEEIENLKRVMKKIRNRKETEYEKFVKTHGLVQADEQLKKNQQARKRARNLFGRFTKMQEMRRIQSKRRQQIIATQASSANRRQFWVSKRTNPSIARKVRVPQRQPNWTEEYEEKLRRKTALPTMTEEEEEAIKKANQQDDRLTMNEIVRQINRTMKKKGQQIQSNLQYFHDQGTRPQQ